MEGLRARYRTAVVALVAIATMAACGDGLKPTAPRKPPSPGQLVGSYRCAQFIGYYRGSKGTGYYQGTCNAYINVTNPKRTLEIEVQPFEITNLFRVTRPDFETADFVYDSAAAQGTMNYPSLPSETYDVWVEGPGTMTRRFLPFDYTGDGVMDSLTLTYVKQ